MNWLGRLLRKNRMEEQLNKELRFHLDEHAAGLVARGVDPEEAHRQARLSLGGPEQVKEECRDARGTRWLEDLWQDFRYALRQIRQKPGFSAVSAITLALGIGASTAIFSAVNPVLFQPLPYPNSGRILAIWDRSADSARSEIAFGTFCELEARSHSFEAMAAFKLWQPAMTGEAEPERIEGQAVTAGYFRVFGVRPTLGRDFTDSDDRDHGPIVAILSDSLWRRKFSGDRGVIGRTITLDGNAYVVIGVMPRGFENVLGPAAEVWSPLQYNRALPLDGREWGHHLRQVGRLRADIGLDQVRREFDSIAHTRVREFARPPWSSMRNGLMVLSLRDDLAGDIKPALLAVLGAVLLLLAIACVNVTNLLLARGAQRRPEFAMRAALGARKTRLARQLLTESLLLAVCGGALGMAVAKLGVQALVVLSPAGLPRTAAIGIDGMVLAFAIGITTLVGLAVGLIPALHVSRDDPYTGMQQGSRRTTGGHQWMRRILTVAEVALALILLVSAGLILRSVRRLFSVQPGFTASNVITMQVRTSRHRYNKDVDAYRYYGDALEAVRTLPGVVSAGFTSLLPISGDPWGIYAVGFQSTSANDRHPAFRYAVTPGYFEAMSIPLRRGRFINEHDIAGAPVAVVINESMAKSQYGGKDPIGQRIHVGPDDWAWATVVGVVGDVKQSSLAVATEDAFYMSSLQGWFADREMSLVARAHGDAAAMAPAIKRAIWSVDKDQPIVRVSTMDELMAKSDAQRRFVLILFEAFGLVALALAAIGIYGVLSGSVGERVREIGLRTALGATRPNIIALIVRQAMSLTAIGVLLGLAGAAASSRAIDSLLFGISHLDAITYGGVVALLFAVAAVACWVPAWRAARVDPAIALRAE